MIRYVENYNGFVIIQNTKTKKYSIRKTKWPHSLKIFISLDLVKKYIDKDM